jgi:hypothetical protein
MIYVETPECDLAEPAFDSSYLDTAERLLAMHSGDEQQAAMRWYRRGIEEANLEDQFSYFWFALEIAAQALKGTEKIPSRCPKCQAPLLCENCGDHPKHRRYPKEAIQQIIERVHPQNSVEVVAVLQRIRNTLMHGARIASLLGQLPCDGPQESTGWPL